MTALSDLLVARSQVTIRTAVYAEWAADGVDIAGLQSTHILRASGEIVSQLEADAEASRLAVTQGGYISGAETLSQPEWLYLLGEDHYQLTVDPATRTEGSFRVTASAAASGTTIGTGRLIVRYGSGATQVLFENVEPFTPVLGSYVAVKMRAQVAGIAGNIGNNATLSLVTSYPGLTVTNPAISGSTTWITSRGRNVEAMGVYADRLRARWADLAWDVVSERFMALVRAAFVEAEQTNPITRIYVDDANPLGPGSIALYMARDAIPATADDIALVDAYLAARWAAGHGRYGVSAAAVFDIEINGTIKGPTNSTSALTQADAALDALEPSYPLGGATVYAEQVRTALMAGVTGALNVTLTLDEETAIPPGSIVTFTIGTLSIVP